MPTLNPALRDFWLTPCRNRILYGGRSSTKTWDTAGIALAMTQAMRLRFLCTRQFQNRIADSVYVTLKLRAEEFGLENDFDFQESSIIHKYTRSEFVFYGLARNLSDIKGLEGIDVGWHEESHLLTEPQWKVIDPTLRKQGSQHWFVFNPQYASDFIYQRFIVNPPPNTLARKINFDENPFLSATMLSVIMAAQLENPDDFAHVYLGEPLNDDARVIIKRSWIEAAIDAHKKLNFKPEGRNVIGFDVADDGADKCANVHAIGSVALWCDEWKGLEDELLKSCSRTYQTAAARGAQIRYDSIGVGAHAGAKFDELNEAQKKRVRYSKFNAGGAIHRPDDYYVRDRMDKIKNKDHFANLKAQTWWLVADRFRNTYDAIMRNVPYPVDELISIDSSMPHLEKLKTELSTPRRDFDQNGRVKVESKKDLEKREIPSPNLADAFVMCYAPEGAGQVVVSSEAIKRAFGRAAA